MYIDKIKSLVGFTFYFQLIKATSRHDIRLGNRMINYAEIEDLFLEADKAFDEGNHAEGKKLLEQILREEPSFGRAHNHLGWLYKNRYQDIPLAEKHYLLSIKFDPSYTPAYINYAYLLRDDSRLKELEDLLNRVLKIEGVNKCSVYDEFGSLYELKGEYKKAIQYYKKAISYCLNDKIINDLTNHIKRCKKKSRMFSFFGLFKRRF